MANTYAPMGFVPLNRKGGRIKLSIYRAETYRAIYLGDPIQQTSSGMVEVGSSGDGGQLIGVALGFMDTNRAAFGTNLELYPYLPANTHGYVMVCDDPEQEYLVTSDTGGGNLTISNVGHTAGFICGSATSGNTASGWSKLMLDSSDAAADTMGAFKIVDIFDAVDNTTGNWCKVVVKLRYLQASFAE